MKPTKGRVVFYKDSVAEYAARIVFVHEDGSVNLAVDGHDGESSFGIQAVTQGDDAGQWNWPPRV
ncbi:hypothetical protein PA598K_01371 [Paenibacillus sp. 598K]|uniref:hypothetical protein n=1 Tax=Paenibacillus sp. 598K TaxID=1117987 RepID=UPI000FFA31D9|nr:hypothetical protein [Paenibacillus sp. 598K]GBF73086.1 hypothetical protein PA598K_01371 [Paenibacillus sp. 598K]